jgi:hypothetical protein
VRRPVIVMAGSGPCRPVIVLAGSGACRPAGAAAPAARVAATRVTAARVTATHAAAVTSRADDQGVESRVPVGAAEAALAVGDLPAVLGRLLVMSGEQPAAHRLDEPGQPAVSALLGVVFAGRTGMVTHSTVPFCSPRAGFGVFSWADVSASAQLCCMSAQRWPPDTGCFSGTGESAGQPASSGPQIKRASPLSGATVPVMLYPAAARQLPHRDTRE